MTTFDHEWTRCRPWLEAALEYAAGTHTVEDVEQAVRSGQFQFWPAEKGAVVTEIIDLPRGRRLHFFLAGGDLDQLQRMLAPIEAWGRAQGCTSVSLAGRKGWERTFLREEGYKAQWVVLVKDMQP